MNATTRKGDWMQLRSGGRFWPLDPRPEDVRIEDIAAGLAATVRFRGQTRQPYTVAEHSVHVANLVGLHNPGAALWGLLHDAAEAYLGDLIRPLKQLPEFAAFRMAEDLIMGVVCERFGLCEFMPLEVQAADEAMLAAEATQLFDVLDPEWSRWLRGLEAAPIRIGHPWTPGEPWTPAMAERQFLKTYRALTEQRS